MGDVPVGYAGFQPGCYVDGVRGIYAVSHLILNVLGEWATPRERRLAHAYERGWTGPDFVLLDEVYRIADEVTARFDESVAHLGLSSAWVDGNWHVVEDVDEVWA